MTSYTDPARPSPIVVVSPAISQDYVALTAIWERAVRATHSFLSEDAILEIRNDIYDIYLRTMDVVVVRLVRGISGPCSDTLCCHNPPPGLLEKALGIYDHENESGISGQFSNSKRPGRVAAVVGVNSSEHIPKAGLSVELPAVEIPGQILKNPVCEQLPETGIPLGFMGISGKHIAMLFIDPPYHRLGLGKMLVGHALARGARSVDVNEQNPAAYEFYRTLGFHQKGRSPIDDQGNPFPILHLHLSI